MKFSYSSDLHIDFYTSYANQKLLNMYSALERTQGVSYHLVAGDTSNSVQKTNEFLANINGVVYCYGNHEYYDGEFTPINDLQVYDLNGVRCVVGTLWTDFNGMNPITILRMRDYMRDSSLIKDYNEENLCRIHKEQREFIFDNQPDVVMTHHAVCGLSINPRYRSLAHENSGYYTDLSNDVMDSKIKVWVSGHTHHRTDYMLGNTRMLSNTRGYPMENNNFKVKVFEL